MPIRPIDLQTLLMQLNQVSRDQAAEKEGAVLQQAMKGAAEQKRLDETKEAVRRPEEPEAGAEAVRDRKKKGATNSEGQERRGGAGQESETESGEEVVRDPELGNRVDLSG